MILAATEPAPREGGDDNGGSLNRQRRAVKAPGVGPETPVDTSAKSGTPVALLARRVVGMMRPTLHSLLSSTDLNRVLDHTESIVRKIVTELLAARTPTVETVEGVVYENDYWREMGEEQYEFAAGEGHDPKFNRRATLLIHPTESEP